MLLVHRKPAAEVTLRQACRPVIVVADRPPDIVTAGEKIELDVHVVSDLHTHIEGAAIEAVASWPGGRRLWRFTGDIDADDVTRIGRIEFVVPDTLGALTIELTLTIDDEVVVNRYGAAITQPAFP